jgi:mannose-6-phosphate isomerase
MELYPIFFSPRFVPKMWGGRTLQSHLGKSLPADKPVGESWEIFDFPPGVVGADAITPQDQPGRWVSAPITNGPLAGMSLHDLMLKHPDLLLGDSKPVATAHGPQFPLLVKFLDARQDLSVQVHPDDAYASSHANAFVKNECWHVLARDSGSRLLISVKPGITKQRFSDSLNDGTCEAQMNAIPVEVGQTYYLPSGTVHALGAGVLAAEVQTPSDTTYRVYDFDRIEPATGKKRALHVEQAMACIDFASQSPTKPVDIVQAPQFQMHVKQNMTSVSTTGRATVLICTKGEARVGDQHIVAGQTVLLPASLGDVAIVGQASWLVSHAK